MIEKTSHYPLHVNTQGGGEQLMLLNSKNQAQNFQKTVQYAQNSIFIIFANISSVS